MSNARPDARSYLFVPGDRPERFAKAAAAGAHRVILDLEDAVAPAGKDAARAAVRAAADAAGPGLVVRVNGLDTPWFAEDLALAAALPGCEVMLPKGCPDTVRAAAAAFAGRPPPSLLPPLLPPLLPLIETVRGLMTLAETAALPGVARIAFGNLDFGVDSGMAEAALDGVRARINLEARFAGLPPPVDGVTAALEDGPALRADIARAKALGFGAKLCIHPRQVAAVNAAFSPSPAELDWARRVLDAAGAAGGAAVAVDGKMVDRPVLLRARAILAAADGADPRPPRPWSMTA